MSAPVAPPVVRRSREGHDPAPIRAVTDALVELIAHLQSELSRRIRRERLTPSLFWLLWSLSRIEPATPGRVAQELGVSLPSVTHALNELESRGLIVRGHDPEDRRKVPLRMTPEGEVKFSALYGLLRQRVRRLLPSLSREESEVLLELMTRLGAPRASPSGRGHAARLAVP